jgi:Cu/Ag efflux protein CusF
VKIVAVALMTSALLPAVAVGAGPAPVFLAQAKTDGGGQPAKAEAGGQPGRAGARTVTIRGTVAAIDKDKQTVTLKGPKGRTLTVHVQDPKKLEAINVGDPVVATYYEPLAFEVKKAGSATPGASAKEAVATSKPGETPAGAVGQQITVTATITGIDKKAQTVTIKGPEGNTETVKARNPKNLDKIKVGDLVEITYTRALALSLDKPAAKPAKADAAAKK